MLNSRLRHCGHVEHKTETGYDQEKAKEAVHHGQCQNLEAHLLERRSQKTTLPTPHDTSLDTTVTRETRPPCHSYGGQPPVTFQFVLPCRKPSSTQWKLAKTRRKLKWLSTTCAHYAVLTVSTKQLAVFAKMCRNDKGCEILFIDTPE